MTGRSRSTRTGLCLLALLLSCISARLARVTAEPEPIPAEFLFRDTYVNNADNNLILLSKLKEIIEERKDMAEREKELADEQREIQSVLEARTRPRAPQNDYSGEELPPPNAIVSQPQHPGKRTAISYMTLCHFKICNMGRKRQLRK